MIPTRAKGITVEQAIHKGLIDPQFCVIRDPRSKETISLRDAVTHGIIIEPTKPLTLFEAIEEGIFDPETGKFTDTKSGKSLTLQQCIDAGLIDPKSREVTDSATGEQITLSEAIEQGILNPITGRVIDKRTGKSMSMAKAWSKGLIGERSGSESESESEKDMESSGDETGKAKAVPGVSRKGVPLVEAVTLGMYDPKTKLATDPQTGRKVNLRQALDSGTILPDGVMVKDKKHRPCSAPGYLTENGIN